MVNRFKTTLYLMVQASRARRIFNALKPLRGKMTHSIRADHTFLAYTGLEPGPDGEDMGGTLHSDDGYEFSVEISPDVTPEVLAKTLKAIKGPLYAVELKVERKPAQLSAKRRRALNRLSNEGHWAWPLDSDPLDSDPPRSGFHIGIERDELTFHMTGLESAPPELAQFIENAIAA
jgi:hypothetical protein